MKYSSGTLATVRISVWCSELEKNKLSHHLEIGCLVPWVRVDSGGGLRIRKAVDLYE